VEERLEQLVLADKAKGADNLHRQLKDEGYSISKKQVRALKKTVLSEPVANDNDNAKTPIIPIISEMKKTALSEPAANSNDNAKTPIIPIISERRPKKHRVLRCRNAKKQAIKHSSPNPTYKQRNYTQKLSSTKTIHRTSLSTRCIFGNCTPIAAQSECS